MDMNVLFKKLQAGETVYIKDDFEEAAIKIVPGKVRVKGVFIKRKGRLSEKEIDKTSKLVLEMKLGGDEITKEEYQHFH